MSLREQVQKYLKESGMSAAKFAADIGYSGPVISSYINGKYAGNVENVEAAIRGYLDLQSDRKTSRELATPFVQTKNSKIVFAVLKKAKLNHTMCVITSRSGMGKTRTAREWAARNRGDILIEVDCTYGTKVLLSELHSRLGLTGKGNKHQLLKEIIGVLYGTERMVVVDEADLLSTEGLEVLKTLNEKGGVGVALLGLPELAVNIRGSRGEFEKLYTRIAGHAKLDSISETDSFAIVESFIPGSDQSLHKAFFQHSRKCGRTLQLLIRNVLDVVNENSIDISSELIERCAEMQSI